MGLKQKVEINLRKSFFIFKYVYFTKVKHQLKIRAMDLVEVVAVVLVVLVVVVVVVVVVLAAAAAAALAVVSQTVGSISSKTLADDCYSSY